MQDLANLISGSEQINASFIFEDHTEGLSDFSVDYKNDNHVYVTSFDSTISLYDIESTKSVAILKGHSKGVWTCSTNPHSNLLVSGGNDNVIFVWDINSHKPIDQIREHNEVVYDVQFASNGKHFASCSKGKICLWDIANLKEPIRILDSLSDTNKNKGKNGFIYCLNFINNDTRLISGYMNGTILIHDIANNTDEMYSIEPNERFEVENELADSLKEYSNSIYSLSKCKAQEKILLAHSDGSVRVYQTENKTFKLENSVQYFTAGVTCANTSIDDQFIIGCGKDRSGQIWPTNSNNVINYSLVGHMNIVSYCDFLRRDLVATCSYDTTFRLWKIKL